MFGPITAVAIDDDPSHLLTITTGLSASGIACTGYWYDSNTQNLNPPPPADRLPYLRLIFMDLNLDASGGNPDSKNLAGTVINVLTEIVAPTSGPYVLVFWTQVSGKVVEVRELIYERLKGIPLPLEILDIPKGNFIVSPPSGVDFLDTLKVLYTELHKNLDALRNAVTDAVTRNPQLSALSHWESRAAEAAGRAVNAVHACAVDDMPPKVPVSDSIQRVLAEIARAASGAMPASELPARALDAGMADILIDQFGASVDVTTYQQIVRKAIGQTLEDAIKPGIKFNKPAQMAADLNTFFHVDKEVKTAKTWDRGVVLPAKDPLTNGILSFSPESMLTSDFFHPYETYPEPEQAGIKAQIAEFKPTAQFVLVELGADCDHAQNSYRTRRYLLGLELPEQYLHLAKFARNNKLRNESLQLLGPWVIESETRYLLVSCRRFWTWQKGSPPKAAPVRYRLRASIVNKLLHHYSVWHSRPGIIEFRPGHTESTRGPSAGSAADSLKT